MTALSPLNLGYRAFAKVLLDQVYFGSFGYFPPRRQKIKYIAAEAIEDGRWCNSEGKGRGGARRIYKDAPYAALRARLGLP